MNGENGNWNIAEGFDQENPLSVYRLVCFSVYLFFPAV